MAEAQSLTERKRKAGGMKEMLQDATKLTHKLRFLIEEVRDSSRLSVRYRLGDIIVGSSPRQFVSNPSLFCVFTHCSPSTQCRTSLFGC